MLQKIKDLFNKKYIPIKEFVGTENGYYKIPFNSLGGLKNEF